uniref:Uncharacterized protein n=1 Tax=Magallana gigas TaxID=29159 RepID=A0A8W8JUE2_MAGGI
MSSPDGSPERASLGQDGISVETDKTCGHDGEPRKSWGGYSIPKKTKNKDSMRTYMKDRYDDDSASSDPYEDDSSEEEGEIDDFTYKSPLSRTREPKEADSDDELDAKRFDPLDDETEYLLDKSKAKYAKKYFKLHLTEEKIRSCILEDAPIPGNEFLNPPEIDDYIEDLVADHKSMKFLKMHDSSLKFVQKRVAQCMGPISRIWEELDKAHEGHTSTMDIEDVVKLLEKTILMIGQVNVASLYERRINFLAKILKSTKKAKSMLRDNEAKLQDDTVLFGNDFYATLYRKSKDRKRAREMSRDIARPVTKKPRLTQTVDQPFRQGPSGEQKRTRGSNFRGRGGITKKQRYVNDVSDKYTDSGRTNIKSFRGSPQSPSNVEKLKLTEIVQNQIPLGGRLKHFASNWEKITKDCSILTELRGYKIDFLITPRQISVTEIHYSEKEYQILNKEIGEMLEKRAVEIVDPKNSVQDQFISTLFTGVTAGNLSGRYSTSESNQRRVDEGQRFPYLVITQPGVVDKLEEISSRTNTNNRVLGSNSRFSRNECLPSSRQNSEYKNEMSKSFRIRPHYNPRIGKFSWIIECNSGGSNSSLTLCQGITNVQNEMSDQRKELQEQNKSVSGVQNRNFLVNSTIAGLEWETNNNKRARLSNRDGCIHDGVGVPLPIFPNKNGGTMEPSIEKTSHKCIRTESCKYCSKISNQKQTKCTHSFENGQYNCCDLCKQDGGNKITHSNKHCKRSMRILSGKKDNSYSRAPSWISQSDSRLGEQECVNHEHQQLEVESQDICSDKFVMGSSRNGPVCGQIKCTAREVHELETRPICYGNRCIPSTLGRNDSICISTILPDTEMHSKSSERAGGISHCDTSMANTTLLSNVTEYVNSRPHSSTPIEGPPSVTRGDPHPLITNGTLKLVVWKISGETKKCMGHQQTLQNYSQHHGGRELNQLTTAAGNTGLAGVVADKLIPFSPLWNI